MNEYELFEILSSEWKKTTKRLYEEQLHELEEKEGEMLYNPRDF